MNAAEQWITDVQGLDALPNEKIVVDESEPRAYQKFGDMWEATGLEERIPSRELPLPLKVVHTAEQWIQDIQGLHDLPDLAVVLGAPADDDSRPTVYEKDGDSWNIPGVEEFILTSEIRLPAKVLYLP